MLKRIATFVSRKEKTSSLDNEDMNLTRRNLLSGAAALAFAAKLPALDGSANPLFEEIATAASGISWVHDNAMSPNRYLPETMGPGCGISRLR